MPSKNRPCPCPSCRGTIRSAKVLRAHAAEQAEIAAEQTNWRRAYESAALQAVTGESDSGSSQESEDVGERQATASSRPPKRSRVDTENEPGENRVCLPVFNYLCIFMYHTYI